MFDMQGYDMEDAMVINKGSYDRGFSHGSIYKNIVNICFNIQNKICVEPPDGPWSSEITLMKEGSLKVCFLPDAVGKRPLNQWSILAKWIF